MPSSLFSIIFYLISFLFSLITLTYSRQVEYRADIVAARLFGGRIFSQALANYVAYSMFFEKNAFNLVQEVAGEGKSFKNIYEFLGKNFDTKAENAIRKSMEVEKTSFWNTHPGTVERIRKIEKVSGLHTLKETEIASNYFRDFTKLQEDATAIISYIHHLQQKQDKKK